MNNAEGAGGVVKPELADQEVERIVAGIDIPPCPAILIELSLETSKDTPDFGKIEKLVSRDVGLSGMFLKTVNSPFYGLRN
ncbi:MAG: HDOD domain-containing protein, partial [Chlorobiaceae bacterium]